MDQRTCRWPGCDRVERKMIRSLCGKHYTRARRCGNYDDPWNTWTTTRPYRGKVTDCRWPDCGSANIKGHGLCNLHNRRARLVGNIDKPWELWSTTNVCVVCGDTFTISRQRFAQFCSDTCNLTDWKRRNHKRYLASERERVRRRRALIAATTTETFTDADVRAAYGDDCYLCGKRIDFNLTWPHPRSPSLDHVIPLSSGGGHTLDNCAMTHWECNNKKGARPTGKRPQPTLL